MAVAPELKKFKTKLNKFKNGRIKDMYVGVPVHIRKSFITMCDEVCNEENEKIEAVCNLSVYSGGMPLLAKTLGEVHLKKTLKDIQSLMDFYSDKTALKVGDNDFDINEIKFVGVTLVGMIIYIMTLLKTMTTQLSSAQGDYVNYLKNLDITDIFSKNDIIKCNHIKETFESIVDNMNNLGKILRDKNGKSKITDTAVNSLIASLRRATQDSVDSNNQYDEDI